MVITQSCRSSWATKPPRLVITQSYQSSWAKQDLRHWSSPAVLPILMSNKTSKTSHHPVMPFSWATRPSSSLASSDNTFQTAQQNDIIHLAMQCCHTVLPYSLVIQSCHTVLSYSLAIHSCHTVLPYSLAIHTVLPCSVQEYGTEWKFKTKDLALW